MPRSTHESDSLENPQDAYPPVHPVTQNNPHVYTYISFRHSLAVQCFPFSLSYVVMLGRECACVAEGWPSRPHRYTRTRVRTAIPDVHVSHSNLIELE